MKKTKQQFLRLIFFLSFIQLSTDFLGQQIYVNREWRDEVGSPVFNPLLSPYGADWSKSIVSPSDNALITVGHTSVSGQGENILLTRFRDDGTILWQTDFNSASTYNDYGIDIIEASNGDIYVCGVSDNGGITNYDVVILVFDSNGSLQYSKTYDGPDNLNDVPASIKIDSNGNLIIAGTSESISTFADYMVLSYDPTLTLNWSNTYDYTNLHDIGAALEIDGGKIHVAGASANSTTDWDMTVASFDESTGSYLSDSRASYPGIGHDQVLSFRKDANGNTFITGKASSNGINFNIRTAKIDANNVLVWAQSYDAFGLEDVGNTIAVDGNGDVIVGGFITKSNNKKDIIVLKYNGSNGNLIWKHTQSSNDGTADALVKAIVLNNNNEIYFIAGEKEISGNKRALVGRLEPDGKKNWEKTMRGNYDFLPSDIQYGGFGVNGIYAIAIKDSTVNSYEMHFFTEHITDSIKIYGNDGNPLFPKRQLVVRFDTSAIIKSIIDNKDITAGKIEDFIKPTVVNSIKSNVAEVFGTDRFDIEVFKIFPEITTQKTKNISRLGDTINIPEFYSILLLQFPPTITITSTANNLINLFPTVNYCEPNYFCLLTSNPIEKYDFQQNHSKTYSQITSIANDSLFSEQASLHPTSTYSTAGVNVEEAWEYETGKNFVKVGVFDNGVFWSHKEFMDSTLTTTKIKGWDFLASTTLTNDPVGTGLNHGTNVTGIIAANRNNIKGIAGIASGNNKQSSYIDSSGVSLHGMRAFTANGNFTNTNISYMANAIIGSAISNPTNTTFEYGLHIMNHSWRVSTSWPATVPYLTDSNMTLLREAVHFSNRSKVTFVAATGNQLSSAPAYPATIDDDWVLTVGGTGTDGGWDATQANYKNNIDLAAPSHYNLIWTTNWAGGEYWQENGTSMAAPHVAAAAGLLLSYHNKPFADPQNLAPEDVEFILQKSAFDIESVGWDTLTGYGRLNIGQALKMISKPKHKVVHFGTDITPSHSKTKALISSGDTIKLTERYRNAAGTWFVPNKKYIVDKYQMSTGIFHGLSSTDSIVYSWPRHSSSNVLEDINAGKLKPRERVTLYNVTQIHASLKGFVYKVKDSLGNYLGWWPFDTTLAKSHFAYSILKKDTAFDVGIKSKYSLKSSLKVYPNPTKNSQTLEITHHSNSKCKIDIIDMLGRIVFTSENQNIISGVNLINIPTNLLQSGIYIYSIKLDNDVLFYKILKE